jgi:hypothetical protein
MPQAAPPLPKVYTITGKWQKIIIVYLIICILSALAAFILVSGLILYHDQLISTTTLPFALVIYVGALILAAVAYLCGTMYVQGRRMRLELLPEGLAFYAIGWRMFTPWDNIEGVDKIPMGRRLNTGLKYKARAVKNIDIANGIEQRKAVTRYNWWTNKRRRYYEGMPLSIDNHQALEQSELGAYLKTYAPQAFVRVRAN